MSYNIVLTTAEDIVAVVDAVIAKGTEAEKEFIAEFTGIATDDQVIKALQMACELQLIVFDSSRGCYGTPSFLAKKLVSASSDEQKAVFMRLILEQYAPYTTFKTRYAFTKSIDLACRQTKTLHAMTSNERDVKNTLISIATYAKALRSEGANLYSFVEDMDAVGIGIIEAALCSANITENSLRSYWGESLYTFVNTSNVFDPLVEALQKNKIGGDQMAERKIRAGYYRRYDRKVVYVISSATDADTGEESVIWTTYPFAPVPRYYTSSKKSFCAFIEVNGERKAKYKRLFNMKISGEAIERLEEEGFRGPVRKRQRPQPDEAYDSREYQQSLTYYAYAKDLCEHYNFDRNKYRLCVKEKRFAAITKSDFAKLKEDLQFLDNALKTVLTAYQNYFRERFVDGLSIRKYADAHQLNRGSVDYQQKKFFSALASLLKERDEAEGTCRLLKPAQK